MPSNLPDDVFGDASYGSRSCKLTRSGWIRNGRSQLYKLIYLARRNPAVSREDWPKTWRSHATFAGKLMTREATLTSMSYNNRIDIPMLAGRPVAVPGVSQAHDGVAVACSESLEALQFGGFAPEDRGLIDQDELRVFDMPTPAFSFFCTETVMCEGDIGEAALFRFLARKKGVSRADFEARFHDGHGKLARAVIAPMDTVSRYTHNRLIQAPPPLFPFEGISECRFATADDAVRTLTGSEFAPLTQDLEEFCDMARSVAMLTQVCRRWPRA